VPNFISIYDAAKNLGYDDIRSIKKWCLNKNVAIFEYNGSNKRYVDRIQFEKACEGNIKVQQNKSTVHIDFAHSRATLPCMGKKPLFIPPNKRLRGLGLYAYCYQCQTNVIDICKEKNIALQKCEFGDRHVFKVYCYVPGTKERKTKVLQTRDVNEAIKLAIEFSQEVKENNIVNNERHVSQLVVKEKKTSGILIKDSIEKYIQWLKGINVPEHLKKERTAHFVDEVKRKLNQFTNCLKANGHDLNVVTVNDINDEIVGEFYQYLNAQDRFGNNTFNKHLSYASSWLRWFSEQHYTIRNWFANVKRKPSNHHPLSIQEEEYNTLLNEVTEENGIELTSSGKRIQHYRYWLKDAIRLGLETGRRREEILKLKFNEISYDLQGAPEFIKIEDFKVNRAQHRMTEEEKKYIFIPVTDSLLKLLTELGYEKYKGSDIFIIAPEESFQREKPLQDTVSRSFSHYIKKVTERPLTFRCLRKNYITSLKLLLGGNAKIVTGHSGDAVIDRHYLVREEVARQAKSLSIFGEVRNQELKETRNNVKRNQNKEVSK
jgi:integrase